MLRKASDSVFDALGNPLRREIVRRLAHAPMSVGALASEFTVSRPAISRHLAMLQGAGLVAHQSKGTRNVYALDPKGFEATRDALDAFWDEAEMRLRLVAENLRDR